MLAENRVIALSPKFRFYEPLSQGLGDGKIAGQSERVRSVVWIDSGVVERMRHRATS